MSTGEDSVNKRYSYVLGNLTGYTNYTIHVVVEASDVAESGDNAIVTGQAKYKRTDESSKNIFSLITYRVIQKSGSVYRAYVLTHAFIFIGRLWQLSSVLLANVRQLRCRTKI